MRKKGFTLVEIMIVVAIIALLAAIAIPNLLRARANANEAAAVSAVKTLATAAISFRSVNNAYPSNIIALGPGNATPSYIDAILGCDTTECLKQGYSFSLTGGTNTFSAIALPAGPGTTGSRSFFVDETGVIKFCTASGGSACTPTVDSSTLE